MLRLHIGVLDRLSRALSRNAWVLDTRLNLFEAHRLCRMVRGTLASNLAETGK